MAEDGLQIIRLKDDFYRDGFRKVFVACAMMMVAIITLLVISFSLLLQKPAPVVFAADSEWRILPLVPLNQPYLKTFDLLQWVSNTIPLAFNYDFVNYAKELESVTPYFTPTGWKAFSDLINAYVNADTVQKSKLFVSGSAAGTPVVVNQGLLANNEYGWWVQMPVKIYYSSYATHYATTVTLRLLVVRVSTLNNLSGVAIDNILRV